jgi:hypothetical protein
VAHTIFLAAGSNRRGPSYFFVVGITLIVFFAPFVALPNGFRRLNAWLAKSRTIRAMARARSGTDGTDQYASDTRIRVVSAVAVVVGAVFLLIGILKVTG